MYLCMHETHLHTPRHFNHAQYMSFVLNEWFKICKIKIFQVFQFSSPGYHKRVIKIIFFLISEICKPP